MCVTGSLSPPGWVSQGPCVPQERRYRRQGVVRSVRAPGKGFAGRRVSQVPACLRRGVTGDRASQSPWVAWEECHRGQGGTGSVYDPGRALQGMGYGRACGCSRRDIAWGRTSCVLQEGCCGGGCVSESLPATLEGDNWAGGPRARMPRGPSASREDPSGVCPSWEAMAQIPVVVCPSDDCGGFAIPTGLVGLLA